MNKTSYFRPEIDRMSGYVPGEQPKNIANLTKLNTNENPYPPTPKLEAVLRDFELDRLRRYPDPMSDAFRDAVARRWGVPREMVLAGNGSDDVLNLVFRAFSSPELSVAFPEPTYSLYPILAAMQGASVRRIALDPDTFAMPDDFAAQAAGANLLLIARPNAPTGNSFPLARIEEVCRNFDGIVLIDEAYADFAADHCMELAKKYPNVIVSRTFSKSYALAGLRLGYAVAAEPVIAGLMKLKDSYNLDALTQTIGLVAFEDEDYLREIVAKIKAERKRLRDKLAAFDFELIASEANFLFAAPPGGGGEALFGYLRELGIVVRYFPGPATGRFVRITVGTPEQDDRLLAAVADFLH